MMIFLTHNRNLIQINSISSFTTILDLLIPLNFIMELFWIHMQYKNVIQYLTLKL
jgi:hypothetical protein